MTELHLTDADAIYCVPTALHLERLTVFFSLPRRIQEIMKAVIARNHLVAVFDIAAQALDLLMVGIEISRKKMTYPQQQQYHRQQHHHNQYDFQCHHPLIGIIVYGIIIVIIAFGNVKVRIKTTTRCAFTAHTISL